MSMRSAFLVMATLALAGCAAGPPPLCSAAEREAGCAVATQLFFGLSRPDGTNVSEAEWQDFLAEIVTPRFPAGFTVSVAEGQWRSDATAAIVRESSRILLIVRRDGEDESGIAALIDAYKMRFRQESVLRLDVKSIARF